MDFQHTDEKHCQAGMICDEYLIKATSPHETHLKSKHSSTRQGRFFATETGSGIEADFISLLLQRAPKDSVAENRKLQKRGQSHRAKGTPGDCLFVCSKGSWVGDNFSMCHQLKHISHLSKISFISPTKDFAE